MNDAISKRFVSVVQKIKQSDQLPSQTELANKLTYTRQYISSVFTGSRPPSNETIKYFHDNFKMNINYLFNPSEPMFLDGKMASNNILSEPPVEYGNAKDKRIADLEYTIELQKEMIASLKGNRKAKSA